MHALQVLTPHTQPAPSSDNARERPRGAFEPVCAQHRARVSGGSLHAGEEHEDAGCSMSTAHAQGLLTSPKELDRVRPQKDMKFPDSVHLPSATMKRQRAPGYEPGSGPKHTRRRDVARFPDAAKGCGEAK